MKISDIYRSLCGLYGIRDALDIEHFLIMVIREPAGVKVRSRLSCREMLLVSQSADSVELGLFIAPEIVAALESMEPLDCLEEFACAAEGASHFLYVADRAARGVAVSQLELELQAEVDKFLLIHLLAAKRDGTVGPMLFEKQFQLHSFDPSLDSEELCRYEAASQFAAKFCSRLLTRYFNPLKLSELFPAVRDFFGRDLAGKLSLLIP
ncbi:MAG: hypothetical protein WC956_00730 [bacterium]